MDVKKMVGNLLSNAFLLFLITAGTEGGEVLNVQQIADSELALRWCTLSLTLMISRIRWVLQTHFLKEGL